MTAAAQDAGAAASPPVVPLYMTASRAVAYTYECGLCGAPRTVRVPASPAAKAVAAIPLPSGPAPICKTCAYLLHYPTHKSPVGAN